MKFTFNIMVAIPHKSEPEPATPLTLELASAEAARSHIKSLTRGEIPPHSVELTSEDGSVSERWYHVDGAWRVKEA